MRVVIMETAKLLIQVMVGTKGNRNGRPALCSLKKMMKGKLGG